MKVNELDPANAEYCPKCDEHYIPFLVSCNCSKYKFDPDAMDRALKAIRSVERGESKSDNKGCDQKS